MRLSTRLGYADGFLKAVERVVKRGEAGVEMVWVAEAYGYDAATRVGYLGARTIRMQLCSGILRIYSTTAALLAMAAAALDEAHTVWGKALERGKQKRDPALGPLEIVAGGELAIGEGLEHLRDLERPHLALYIGGMGARSKNFYNDLACQYDFEREAAEIQ